MIRRHNRTPLLKLIAVVFCVTLATCLTIRIWFPSLPRYGFFSLIGALKGANTQYASEFNPLSWDRIKVGASEDELYARFSRPLVIGDRSWIYDWKYDQLGLTITLDDRVPDGGNVISNSYDDTKNQDVEEKYQGMSSEQLRNALGEPSSIEKRSNTVVLWYSTPRGGFGQSDYVQFTVGVDPTTKNVVGKNLDYYFD